MKEPILSASGEEPPPLPDVEEVGFGVIAKGLTVAPMFGAYPQMARIGAERGISLASFRRF
jgi:hypothetical protein